MRIILDENLPFGLKASLAPRSATTVREAGFAGLKNGQLLAALEGHFDLMITADKNLRYQQNLKNRKIAILELPTNRCPRLRQLQDKIVAAIEQCQASAYVVLEAD